MSAPNSIVKGVRPPDSGLDINDNLLLKGTKIILDHLGTEKTLEIVGGTLYVNGAPVSNVAGTLVSVVLAAGATNNYSPAGFGAGVDRLDLNPSSGAANLTGFIAGADGQEVTVSNIHATNAITLNNQSASSTAANRFRASDDIVISAGNALLLKYYGGTVTRWVVVP